MLVDVLVVCLAFINQTIVLFFVVAGPWQKKTYIFCIVLFRYAERNCRECFLPTTVWTNMAFCVAQNVSVMSRASRAFPASGGHMTRHKWRSYDKQSWIVSLQRTKDLYDPPPPVAPADDDDDENSEQNEDGDDVDAAAAAAPQPDGEDVAAAQITVANDIMQMLLQASVEEGICRRARTSLCNRVAGRLVTILASHSAPNDDEQTE